MRNRAESFAARMLQALGQLDERAKELQLRAQGETAVVGLVDDNEWVPLLRVSHPSKSYNVMNLDVRHHNRWEPTFIRGIPKQLAEHLAGPLRYIWKIHLTALQEWSRTSEHEH